MNSAMWCLINLWLLTMIEIQGMSSIFLILFSLRHKFFSISHEELLMAYLFSVAFTHGIFISLFSVKNPEKKII